MISDRNILRLVIAGSLAMSLAFSALAFASPGETGPNAAVTPAVEVAQEAAELGGATDDAAIADASRGRGIVDDSTDEVGEDSREVISLDVIERESDSVHAE